MIFIWKAPLNFSLEVAVGDSVRGMQRAGHRPDMLFVNQIEFDAEYPLEDVPHEMLMARKKYLIQLHATVKSHDERDVVFYW